jgi:putative N6-adenine-specific DNA methylase
VNEFFVVALPGLEDIVQAEIKAWYPGLETEVIHGGINVKAPLDVGLSMNLTLKTATRVLLRIASFRSRDFPNLFSRVRKIDWSQYIDPTCELVVSASTRMSRIKIKRRVEETCEDAWADYQKTQRAIRVRGRKAHLYVRFIEDHCTLSLDTSGERLHKRGERTQIGEAPLRETIAAALLRMTAATASDVREVEVVDPMMGSGTFLLEAATAYVPVSSRDFGFEVFVAKNVRAPVGDFPAPQVVSLTGFEADKKTLSAAKENLRGIENVTIHQANIFTAQALPEAKAARWVLCNPPYGERIKVKEPLPEYYAKLFAAVEKIARPDRACFLLPSKSVKGKFTLPLGWKVVAKRPFVNGGIPVVAFVFERTTSA